MALSKSGASSSTYLGNSAVATLAQKCAMGQHHPRLKLLEAGGGTANSSSGQQHDAADASAAATLQTDLVNSLADQLQELRAFGASLRVSTTLHDEGDTPLSGSSSSATNTIHSPILLRP